MARFPFGFAFWQERHQKQVIANVSSDLRHFQSVLALPRVEHCVVPMVDYISESLEVHQP
jgi:hypothetical protein